MKLMCRKCYVDYDLAVRLRPDFEPGLRSANDIGFLAHHAHASSSVDRAHVVKLTCKSCVTTIFHIVITTTITRLAIATQTHPRERRN